MATIRKIERAADSAFEKYNEACADVIRLSLITDELGADVATLAELARLRRRAGAYHSQWIAACRRLEEAIDREEVRA